MIIIIIFIIIIIIIIIIVITVNVDKLMLFVVISLREEIFSRLLSEVLTSVQDSVQKEMGLGLEGLRQQLSEIVTSSDQSPIQQASNPAKTQVRAITDAVS